MFEPVATCKLSAGYHCYGLAWSPFNTGLLAVVSGTNYGLKGGGRVELLRQGSGGWQRRLVADWPDVVVDAAWSELAPSLLLVAAGDRAVALLNTDSGQVLACDRGQHSTEVSSVTWSPVRGHSAAISTGWDGTARQWDPQTLACTRCYPVASARVYDAAWSPHSADQFVTAAGDGHLSVWSGAAAGGPPLRLRGSQCELLSCDWSRYHPHQVVSAGVDGCLRTWDLRGPGRPLCQLTGHTQAIKKVRYAAFSPDLLASVSYDTSCRLWSQAEGRCLAAVPGHSEFVYGLDWSVLEHDLLATCGWDGCVRVGAVVSPGAAAPPALASPAALRPGKVGSP